MEWIFTQHQHYSEVFAAAGLSVSAAGWAVQEEGSLSTSLTENVGTCQGEMWKDAFIPWSAVGAVVGLRD